MFRSRHPIRGRGATVVVDGVIAGVFKELIVPAITAAQKAVAVAALDAVVIVVAADVVVTLAAEDRVITRLSLEVVRAVVAVHGIIARTDIITTVDRFGIRDKCAVATTDLKIDRSCFGSVRVDREVSVIRRRVGAVKQTEEPATVVIGCEL